MSFFDRLAKGWEISMSSLKVLNENKQLIIFPILSGLSMILVLGSFLTVFMAGSGWHFNGFPDLNRGSFYAVLFLFYVINYVIIVFFNMALMHCAKLYFAGEEVTVAKGLQFSAGRIGVIFSWALFSATVGIVLRIIQDNTGWLGKIITSIIGIVWSTATFFAVPVIAYENLSPMDAVKRSVQIMKDKWGESLGATFSIGFIQFFALAAIGVFAYTIGYFVNDVLGIALFVSGVCLLFAVSSAARSIFISAVYNNINGDINRHFRQQLLDGLFERQEK